MAVKMPDPDRLKQVYEIYSEVVALPGVERQDALEERCGDDESLHNEVLALLQRADFCGQHPHGRRRSKGSRATSLKSASRRVSG